MTYRTSATVQDPNQVVLTGLPFLPGEEVEVVVVSKGDRTARVQVLRDLLARTQALPQVQTITEDEIREEIESYRSGR